MKRIKVVPKKPNKLFEEWLEEWRDEAIEKNSHLQYGISKALTSLRKYPLKLETGQDCIILEHFGEKLCKMIDSKLGKHLAAQEKLAHDKSNVKQMREKMEEVMELPEPVSPKTRKQKPKNVTKKAPLEQMIVEPINQEIIPMQKLRLKPHTFDILLLVDVQEVNRSDVNDPTITELTKTGILFEVRHLTVGDFTWIARCKISGQELVLPYVIERKRIDDLSSSIMDGRFHEQKFRLKRSGVQNIIYMVENLKGYDKASRGISMLALRQAVTNSRIQDGFTVRYTRNHRDSMLYLSTMTTALYRQYKDKELVQCEKENLVPSTAFEREIYLLDFQKFHQDGAKIKNLKVKDMFVRQLIKLSGLSLEKVCAIVNRWPSPLALAKALEESSDSEKMLATIPYGSLNKNLGLSIAKTISKLYTQERLN